MKINMKNNHGFTLIEALLIILLIGILAAIAIPRIGSSEKSAYSSARQIVSDLRYTRTLAVTTGQRHYLKFFPASGLYTSSTKLVTYGIYRDEASTDVQIGDTRIISTKVTCTSTLEEFNFNYLGIGTAGLDGLITISTYRVSVNASTGRIYESKI